jgi:putative hydrolase of the HAD superfamily
MKAVLFDLDDTLYTEMDFVRSGFAAVADHLRKLGADREKALACMLSILEKEGRGQVFDGVLREFGLYTEDRVKVLLFCYRAHRPKLVLPGATRRVLEALKEAGLKMGIITDGASMVQRNKTDALGLGQWMDIIIHTDILGEKYWKPSQIPYRIALEMLDVPPEDAAYVGDNPAKDFFGANGCGLATIQLLSAAAPSKVREPEGAYRARHQIRALDELLPLVLKS